MPRIPYELARDTLIDLRVVARLEPGQEIDLVRMICDQNDGRFPVSSGGSTSDRWTVSTDETLVIERIAITNPDIRLTLRCDSETGMGTTVGGPWMASGELDKPYIVPVRRRFSIHAKNPTGMTEGVTVYLRTRIGRFHA